MREARREEDLVIFLDLLKHFRSIGDINALQDVEAWEIVYQAGLAVLAAAKEGLPHPVPEALVEGLRKAWERAADATETPKPAELDLGKMASGMVAAGTVLLPLAGLPTGTALAVGAGAAAARTILDNVRRGAAAGSSSSSRGRRSVGYLLYTVGPCLWRRLPRCSRPPG